MKIGDLPTPALVLDLDSMERNLSRMAGFFRDKPAKLRPHFKAHQVLSLAAKQMRAGAIGITCARLEHAEALVQEGVESVLIANEIAGASMIKRLVDLSRQAPVMVAVDNPKIISEIARLANDRAHEINIIVDLDVRLGRCGVRPGERALSLVNLVLESGLKFRGLMGYEGHVRLPAGPEKEQVVHAALQSLITMQSAIERQGIPVEIVSCGGTSDYSVAGTHPQVTEVQAGSYLLMDTWYLPVAPEFSPTLTVLTTIVSKTCNERIVVDAGLKAMSGDHGFPSIKGVPGLRVKAMHIEHTIIDITGHGVNVDVGDKIEMWVPFLDPTLILNGRMYGARGDEIEEILQVER